MKENQEVLRGVNHEDSEVAIAFSRVLVDSFPDKAADNILKRIEKAENATSYRFLRLLAPLELSLNTQQLYRLESRGDSRLQSTVLLMRVENGDERMVTVLRPSCAAVPCGRRCPCLTCLTVCSC